MDDPKLLFLWLAKALAQVPGLTVALVGCVVVLVRRKRTGAGAGWALAGFGLALVLGTIEPGAQIMFQQRLLGNDRSLAQIGAAGIGFELLGTGLHAVVSALLLVAVCVGRGPAQFATPPPLPR